MHPRKDPIKVGVIGLGTGTIAVYGSKGDTYRFYDINPGVIDIAKRDFSYLKDSDATIELPLGDARLTLEREAAAELRRARDRRLLERRHSRCTSSPREAVEVYLRHMKPDGVIAFHVTNRYLDLVPVVEGIAHELDLHALWISDEGDLPLANSSSWVLRREGPGAPERPAARGSRDQHQRPPRLARVDRRLQQSRAGVEVALNRGMKRDGSPARRSRALPRAGAPAQARATST